MGPRRKRYGVGVYSIAVVLFLALVSPPEELRLIHFSSLRTPLLRASPSRKGDDDHLELLIFKEHRVHDPLLAPRGERHRVAVISFSNATKGGEASWLSWEFADSIIRNLGAADGVEIIDPNAVRPWEKHLGRGKRGELSKGEIESLARRVGADVVILGRYESAEESVRVEFQGFRPSNGVVSRIVSFQGRSDRIWDLEADLARGVAEILGARMSDEEKDRLRESPTNSAIAFEQFSRGRQAPDGSYSKVQYLQKACEADPGFARAHYLLGNAYCGIGMTYQYVEWFNKALAEYRRAVALDPDCAEAYCAMGIVYMINGRYDLSRKALSKALELKPEMKLAWGYLRRLEGMGY